MIDTFRIDEVYFASAAALVAQCADKIERIGETAQLMLWLGTVPHHDVVESFWPYLVKEFDKLNPYRDYRADVIHENRCTGIKVKLITRREMMAIEKETAERKAAF